MCDTFIAVGSGTADGGLGCGKNSDRPADEEQRRVHVPARRRGHGGGASQTEERRHGISMTDCAGFIRQQENQQLGIPRAIARGFGPRLRQLVGYGVYRFLIGHVDKQDPVKLLGDDTELAVIWDR